MNTPIVGMRLRGGLPQDAPQIAELIMEAMSAGCCAYFYGEHHTAKEFHTLLTELCLQTNSQYSFLNTIVAAADAKVLGIAVSYNGAQLHALRKAFVDGALRMFNRDFSGIKDETQAGELYLDSFAVRANYRCKGIGKCLLEATLEKARGLGIAKVGLLVDEANSSAERLYKLLGFQCVGVSDWGGHGMKHLQRSV